jgi:hypothetical protein
LQRLIRRIMKPVSLQGEIYLLYALAWYEADQAKTSRFVQVADALDQTAPGKKFHHPQKVDGLFKN